MILLRYNDFSTGGELFLKFYDYPIISKESSLPVFLVSVGLNEWQYHVKCDKGDNYAKALYCTKGSGVLIMNGEKHIIKPYTAFFIPAGCPHEYYSTDESWDTHWIKPSGKSCPDMLKALGFDKPKIFPLSKEEITYLYHCFRCMHEALMSDKVDGNFRASGYLYSFFIELSRLAAKGKGSVQIAPAVTKAIAYIDENYMKQPGLESISKAAGVSSQHLCRLFRQTLNCRPMEYITKRKIQAAKMLLAETQKTVDQIAEETGFCDSSYFCKIFKRFESITPSQFRSIEQAL